MLNKTSNNTAIAKTKIKEYVNPPKIANFRGNDKSL